MYPTTAIIIIETIATPIIRPISFILRVSFSADGLSVKRGTIFGGTAWVVEDGIWTVEGVDEAPIVDGIVFSVVQSKMRSRNHWQIGKQFQHIM